MAIEAMTYVWNHSAQSKAKLLLMLALADSANAEDWSCYPSVAHLARKARLTPDYTSASLQELAAAGEIEIERFGGAKTSNGYTNRYYVLLDGQRKLAGGESSRLKGGESSRPTRKLSAAGGESSRLKGSEVSPPEPSVEPSVEPTILVEVEEPRARTHTREDSSPAQEQPAVYLAYEQNVGLLTPMIAERLKLLVSEYSETWVEAAIREAVLAGVRKLPYVEAVLANWKTNGFGSRPKAKAAVNGSRTTAAPAAQRTGFSDEEYRKDGKPMPPGGFKPSAPPKP